MKMRIFALILTIFLLLASAAWAAPGDVTLYMDLDNGMPQTRRVMSTAAVGDTIYAACSDDEADERYLLLALKAGETAPQDYAFADQEYAGSHLFHARLLAWGDRLALLDPSDGRLYEVTLAEGQAVLNEKVQLQLVEKQGLSPEEAEDFWPEFQANPWVQGNALYTVSHDYEGGGSIAAAYDLTDGTGRTVSKGLDLGYAAPGRAGELLYATPNRDDHNEVAVLHALSLQDGSASEVCKLMTNQPSGMTYDAVNNRVIYMSEGTGTLYATALDGKQEELRTLPVTYLYDATTQYIPEGDFLVVGGRQSGLIVRNLDPQYRATRTLTIRVANLEVDEAYMAFTASHPEAEIKALTQNGYASGDEVTQAMMNGSSEADIYVLDVDSAAFNAMVSRGYVADLSGSEILSEAVARMYPPFADVLMKDGKVIAFPKEENDLCASFNAEVGAEMGITPPKTWDELLDLVERWDADFSQEYPEKALYNPGESAELKKTLIMNILTDYETLLNRPGQEQEFDTPALNHLFERLEQIDYAPFNSEKDFSNGYTFSSEDVLIGTWSSFLPSLYGSSFMGDTGRTSLLLRLSDDTEPAVPVTMTVYVVNPYSKNQDLAIEYLEACMQAMPAHRQLTYFTDWTGAIETPYFRTDLAAYDKRISEYTQMLNDAAEDEKQQYQQLIDSEVAERRTFIEEEQYAYTEEQVREYQENAKYAVVLRSRYISGNSDDGVNEMASIVQRYIDGQMDAEHMLKELDQKLHMMQMENTY